MNEAWIQLQCPTCEEHWEANPSDLPAPGTDFTCRSCDATNPTREFMRTARDLEILDEFHDT